MKKLAILGTGDADIPDASTPAPINDAARSCRPELVSVPGVVFPGSPVARDTCAQAYLQAGLAAEQAGYAGLYINTVGDYGLAQLRAAARVPVTGSGEAAIHAATSAGQRFAIVTIWPPSLGFIYSAILKQSDAVKDCVAIYHLSADEQLASLDQPDNFVQQMQACSMTSMTSIRSACRQALETENADIIILGCTCMQPVAALLADDGIPVIEPMVAGYQYLEQLVA